MCGNLSAHCVYIRSKPGAGHYARMEIAIRAFRLAERNLYVDSQSILHRQNSNTSLRTADCLKTPSHCRKDLLPRDQVPRSICCHLDPHLPFARPIELTEKYSLPGAQGEFPAFDEDHLTCADHDRLGMRIGVPFSVLVRALVRHQPIEN